MLVEQPGDVRPGVDRFLAVLPARHAVQVDVGPAAHRVLGAGAVGRPSRDQEQVRRERPRVGRREHAVLQDEMVGVGPVVRDRPSREGGHDPRLALRAQRSRARRVRAVGRQAVRLGRGEPAVDEPVHLATVDVGDRVEVPVRTPARVDVGADVGRDAATALIGVGDTDREGPVCLGRDPVGAGVGAEVVIERSVLLHDEDEVVDLLQALRLGGWARGGGRDTAGRPAFRRRTRPRRRRAGGHGQGEDGQDRTNRRPRAHGRGVYRYHFAP